MPQYLRQPSGAWIRSRRFARASPAVTAPAYTLNGSGKFRTPPKNIDIFRQTRRVFSPGVANQKTTTPNGCASLGTSDKGKTIGEEGISVSIPPVPICRM